MNELRFQFQMSNGKPAPKTVRDWRVLVLWLLVLLAGLAALTGIVSASRVGGALFAFLGACGCAWETGKWVRLWRGRRDALQQAQQRAEMQAAQKTRRQVRKVEQQARLQQHKAIQTQARHSQQQRLQAERQAQSERAAQQAEQRSARFAHITQEAERLQTLDAATFRAEAERIFTLRGLTVVVEDGVDTSTLLFVSLTDNHREIVRFMADSETAAVADVEALETARRQADATQAHLIGRNGFTPAAVRLAQRFPITFVEPHLLAQWKTTAEAEEN